jgi:hypothetical protein
MSQAHGTKHDTHHDLAENQLSRSEHTVDAPQRAFSPNHFLLLLLVHSHSQLMSVKHFLPREALSGENGGGSSRTLHAGRWSAGGAA